MSADSIARSMSVRRLGRVAIWSAIDCMASIAWMARIRGIWPGLGPGPRPRRMVSFGIWTTVEHTFHIITKTPRLRRNDFIPVARKGFSGIRMGTDSLSVSIPRASLTLERVIGRADGAAPSHTGGTEQIDLDYQSRSARPDLTSGAGSEVRRSSAER